MLGALREFKEKSFLEELAKSAGIQKCKQLKVFKKKISKLPIESAKVSFKPLK